MALKNAPLFSLFHVCEITSIFWEKRKLLLPSFFRLLPPWWKSFKTSLGKKKPHRCWKTASAGKVRGLEAQVRKKLTLEMCLLKTLRSLLMGRVKPVLKRRFQVLSACSSAAAAFKREESRRLLLKLNRDRETIGGLTEISFASSSWTKTYYH